MNGFEKILLGVITILATLFFLNSHGTGDVDIWIEWFENADTFGFIDGYDESNDDYPPLSWAMLFSVAEVGEMASIDSFIVFKSSLILFVSLTSLVFWLWTKDFWATLILHWSQILNSVALGYIDIYFAPPLILSLWFLKKRELLPFGFFFALAFLIKWQPLIIFPFIFLYLINVNQFKRLKDVDWKSLILRAAFPVLGMIMLLLLIFRYPMIKAFKAAMTHTYLSGNALNLCWVITFFLHLLNPDEFGELDDGQIDFIFFDEPSFSIFILPKLLFIGFFIFLVVRFFKREKTFENLILYSTVGYLAYFTLNTGVHENHLFIPVILGIILYFENKRHRFMMITLIVISNLNLLIFYGMSGDLEFSRVTGVDISLLIALFNICFFAFAVRSILHREEPTRALPDPV